jgi:hypothetical protein
MSSVTERGGILWSELLDAVFLFRCSIMLYACANVDLFRTFISSLYIPTTPTLLLTRTRTTNTNICMKGKSSAWIICDPTQTSDEARRLYNICCGRKFIS